MINSFYELIRYRFKSEILDERRKYLIKEMENNNNIIPLNVEQEIRKAVRYQNEQGNTTLIRACYDDCLSYECNTDTKKIPDYTLEQFSKIVGFLLKNAGFSSDAERLRFIVHKNKEDQQDALQILYQRALRDDSQWPKLIFLYKKHIAKYDKENKHQPRWLFMNLRYLIRTGKPREEISNHFQKIEKRHTLPSQTLEIFLKDAIECHNDFNIIQDLGEKGATLTRDLISTALSSSVTLPKNHKFTTIPNETKVKAIHEGNKLFTLINKTSMENYPNDFYQKITDKCFIENTAIPPVIWTLLEITPAKISDTKLAKHKKHLLQPLVKRIIDNTGESCSENIIALNQLLHEKTINFNDCDECYINSRQGKVRYHALAYAVRKGNLELVKTLLAGNKGNKRILLPITKNITFEHTIKKISRNFSGFSDFNYSSRRTEPKFPENEIPTDDTGVCVLPIMLADFDNTNKQEYRVIFKELLNNIKEDNNFITLSNKLLNYIYDHPSQFDFAHDLLDCVTNKLDNYLTEKPKRSVKSSQPEKKGIQQQKIQPKTKSSTEVLTEEITLVKKSKKIPSKTKPSPNFKKALRLYDNLLKLIVEKSDFRKKNHRIFATKFNQVLAEKLAAKYWKLNFNNLLKLNLSLINPEQVQVPANKIFKKLKTFFTQLEKQTSKQTLQDNFSHIIKSLCDYDIFYNLLDDSSNKEGNTDTSNPELSSQLLKLLFDGATTKGVSPSYFFENSTTLIEIIQNKFKFGSSEKSFKEFCQILSNLFEHPAEYYKKNAELILKHLIDCKFLSYLPEFLLEIPKKNAKQLFNKYQKQILNLLSQQKGKSIQNLCVCLKNMHQIVNKEQKSLVKVIQKLYKKNFNKIHENIISNQPASNLLTLFKEINKAIGKENLSIEREVYSTKKSGYKLFKSTFEGFYTNDCTTDARTYLTAVASIINKQKLAQSYCSKLFLEYAKARNPNAKKLRVLFDYLHNNNSKHLKSHQMETMLALYLKKDDAKNVKELLVMQKTNEFSSWKKCVELCFKLNKVKMLEAMLEHGAEKKFLNKIASSLPELCRNKPDCLKVVLNHYIATIRNGKEATFFQTINIKLADFLMLIEKNKPEVFILLLDAFFLPELRSSKTKLPIINYEKLITSVLDAIASKTQKNNKYSYRSRRTDITAWKKVLWTLIARNIDAKLYGLNKNFNFQHFLNKLPKKYSDEIVKDVYKIMEKICSKNEAIKNEATWIKLNPKLLAPPPRSKHFPQLVESPKDCITKYTKYEVSQHFLNFFTKPKEQNVQKKESNPLNTNQDGNRLKGESNNSHNLDGETQQLLKENDEFFKNNQFK